MSATGANLVFGFREFEKQTKDQKQLVLEFNLTMMVYGGISRWRKCEMTQVRNHKGFSTWGLA
ncbi:Hypothetical predicted protein, partial [Marmota monax]